MEKQLWLIKRLFCQREELSSEVQAQGLKPTAVACLQIRHPGERSLWVHTGHWLVSLAEFGKDTGSTSGLHTQVHTSTLTSKYTYTHTQRKEKWVQ